MFITIQNGNNHQLSETHSTVPLDQPVKYFAFKSFRHKKEHLYVVKCWFTDNKNTKYINYRKYNRTVNIQYFAKNMKGQSYRGLL